MTHVHIWICVIHSGGYNRDDIISRDGSCNRGSII